MCPDRPFGIAGVTTAMPAYSRFALKMLPRLTLYP